MYGQYVLKIWDSAQIYPILDKAQSSLKDEIKGTLQILKPAKRTATKDKFLTSLKPKMANLCQCLIY